MTHDSTFPAARVPRRCRSSPLSRPHNCRCHIARSHARSLGLGCGATALARSCGAMLTGCPHHCSRAAATTGARGQRGMTAASSPPPPPSASNPSTSLQSYPRYASAIRCGSPRILQDCDPIIDPRGGASSWPQLLIIRWILVPCVHATGSAAAGSGRPAMLHGLENEYDYLFRIVLICDSRVNESNILSQFTRNGSQLQVHQPYSDDYLLCVYQLSSPSSPHSMHVCFPFVQMPD
jgi:Ras-related protein Rab-11A